MGYAVYHGSKGKGSGGGVGNHIDRTKGMEHTFKHADPDRLSLNKNLIGKNSYSGMKLPEAIDSRIKSGYKGKRAPRKDAVKYLSHVLTGSHAEMKGIFRDQDQMNSWLQKNYDFIAGEYGKENILRFTLHLDEKTPHVHAITVPLTEDGRLSAKEVYGNKAALTARQDRYAEAMQQFGLKRGLKRTGIKHENAKDYYSRIAHAQNNVENEVRDPSKNLLGIYRQNSVQEMQNALKSANLALADLNGKYQREQIKSRSKEESEERARGLLQKKKTEVMQLQKNAAEFLENVRNIFRDPEAIKSNREKILADDRAREQKKERNRDRGIGY